MRKRKKLFYNTGVKISFSFYDIVKFKLRLGDYDDTFGIRYRYLISFKLFNLEFCRTRYINQQGKVYKRAIGFGG